MHFLKVNVFEQCDLIDLRHVGQGVVGTLSIDCSF